MHHREAQRGVVAAEKVDNRSGAASVDQWPEVLQLLERLLLVHMTARVRKTNPGVVYLRTVGNRHGVQILAYCVFRSWRRQSDYVSLGTHGGKLAHREQTDSEQEEVFPQAGDFELVANYDHFSVSLRVATVTKH